MILVTRHRQVKQRIVNAVRVILRFMSFLLFFCFKNREAELLPPLGKHGPPRAQNVRELYCIYYLSSMITYLFHENVMGVCRYLFSIVKYFFQPWLQFALYSPALEVALFRANCETG